MIWIIPYFAILSIARICLFWNSVCQFLHYTYAASISQNSNALNNLLNTHLESNWSNKTLYLGCTEALLSLAFLQWQRTFYCMSPYIFIFAHVKQLADLGSSLWTKTPGNITICKSRYFLGKNKHNKYLRLHFSDNLF